jgi:hypothetical protein
MGASSLTPRTGRSPNLAAGISMRFGAIVATLAIQALLLFGGADTLHWPWAWVYFAISLAIFLINGALMLRLSPDTIAERGRPREMRGWDKAVSGIGGLAMYLALPLVAGLDVRFGWTPALSVAWHATGALVLAAGYGLTAWAMDSNAYFSTIVRTPSARASAVTLCAAAARIGSCAIRATWDTRSRRWACRSCWARCGRCCLHL